MEFHIVLTWILFSSEQWDKVEDKYAVSSLAVAGVVALWGSTGMISVRSQNMHICLV